MELEMSALQGVLIVLAVASLLNFTITVVAFCQRRTNTVDPINVAFWCVLAIASVLNGWSC